MVCIQEIKAKEVQLTDSVFTQWDITALQELSGPLSGTAVFCRRSPRK